MSTIKNKAASESGETIAETLVALLISALALVMLAGAVSTSASIIKKSRAHLDGYYSSNELANGVVKKQSGGTTVTGGITIGSSYSYDIIYFVNDEFTSKPVVSYKLN